MSLLKSPRFVGLVCIVLLFVTALILALPSNPLGIGAAPDLHAARADPLDLTLAPLGSPVQSQSEATRVTVSQTEARSAAIVEAPELTCRELAADFEAKRDAFLAAAEKYAASCAADEAQVAYMRSIELLYETLSEAEQEMFPELHTGEAMQLEDDAADLRKKIVEQLKADGVLPRLDPGDPRLQTPEVGWELERNAQGQVANISLRYGDYQTTEIYEIPDTLEGRRLRHAYIQMMRAYGMFPSKELRERAGYGPPPENTGF